MQSLNSADEQSLLDGVKKAVDLVDNQGMSPNAAMQKVAEDMSYSPGFVKAACSAFNNGRQLAQWKANDNILDKLAGFPLADYEAVHESMWGDSQEKVASALPFNQPPIQSYADQERQAMLDADLSTFEKAAEAVEVHPSVTDYEGEQRVKRAFDLVEWERRQVEEARREKAANDDQLNLKVHLLESYFRKFAYDRLPLAQVEKAAAVYYGEAGKALLGYVADRFPQEKRAADHQPTWDGFHQAADRTAEPYTLIEACIKTAESYNLSSSRLVEAEEKLAAADEAYQSFTQPRPSAQSGSQAALTPSLLPDSAGQNSKEANILAGLAGGAGMGLTRSVAGGIAGPDNSKQQLEGQINELESPDHQNELRKIRAQTVLTQLMSDPEGPLSQHDPEEVLAAYNEMVQLSPRLADQPSAIGPLLNKKLMGETEPFEVAEQVNLEKGLKDVQAPPSSANKPSSEQVDLMNNETSILS